MNPISLRSGFAIVFITLSLVIHESKEASIQNANLNAAVALASTLDQEIKSEGSSARLVRHWVDSGDHHEEEDEVRRKTKHGSQRRRHNKKHFQQPQQEQESSHENTHEGHLTLEVSEPAQIEDLNGEDFIIHMPNIPTSNGKGGGGDSPDFVAHGVEGVPILDYEDSKHNPEYVVDDPNNKFVPIYLSTGQDQEPHSLSPEEKDLFETLGLSKLIPDIPEDKHSSEIDEEASKHFMDFFSNVQDDKANENDQAAPHESEMDTDKSSVQLTDNLDPRVTNTNDPDPDTVVPIEVVAKDGRGFYKKILADEQKISSAEQNPNNEAHEMQESGNDDELLEGPDHITVETDSAISGNQTEYRCAHLAEIWNGTKSTWKAFRGAETWNHSFAILGKSASDAMHSVVSCTKSVWKGFKSFIGLKKRSAPLDIGGASGPTSDTQDVGTSVSLAEEKRYASALENIKSRKRRSLGEYWNRLTDSFKNKRESMASISLTGLDDVVVVERDALMDKRNAVGHELEPMEVKADEGFAEPAKRALGEAGDEFKRFFARGYAALSDLGNPLTLLTGSTTTDEDEDRSVREDKEPEDVPAEESKYEVSDAASSQTRDAFNREYIQPSKKYFESIRNSFSSFFSKRR